MGTRILGQLASPDHWLARSPGDECRDYLTQDMNLHFTSSTDATIAQKLGRPRIPLLKQHHNPNSDSATVKREVTQLFGSS
jgi:hypothetical protein